MVHVGLRGHSRWHQQRSAAVNKVYEEVAGGEPENRFWKQKYCNCRICDHPYCVHPSHVTQSLDPFLILKHWLVQLWYSYERLLHPDTTFYMGNFEWKKLWLTFAVSTSSAAQDLFRWAQWSRNIVILLCLISCRPSSNKAACSQEAWTLTPRCAESPQTWRTCSSLTSGPWMPSREDSEMPSAFLRTGSSLAWWRYVCR